MNANGRALLQGRLICIISNFQTFWSFKRPDEVIFSVRIGPPVLADLSEKRLNRDSAIKSKKLGYESHSNSMVRTGTFFCMGVLIVKVENLFFLIFLRPLCSPGRVVSKTPLIIVYPSATKKTKRLEVPNVILLGPPICDKN